MIDDKMRMFAYHERTIANKLYSSSDNQYIMIVSYVLTPLNELQQLYTQGVRQLYDSKLTATT